MNKIITSFSKRTSQPDPIPYGRHWIGEEEYQEVLKTLQTGYLTTGPKVELFENQLRDYLGARYVVATSSCSAALHLSLLAHGIGAGDEVITTVWTFVATSNAILHVGAKPVFVDIEDQTYNIDIRKIKEKITPRTKAILPVHYGGHPCPMGPVREIAQKAGLAVIEDAAHAIGAQEGMEKTGKASDAACFSFHPVKNMTTAEGGAVATHSQKIAERVRALRLHGIEQDFYKREKSGDVTAYPQMQHLGFKYNMTDLQAALGLHQLAKLDGFIQRRTEIAEFYFTELHRREELALPSAARDVKHAWHLYPIRLRLEKLKIDRDMFMEKLAKKSIVTAIHYLPVHRHQYYQNRFGFKRGDFPVADHVFDSIVTIPLYAKMTDEDARRVTEAIHQVLDENRR